MENSSLSLLHPAKSNKLSARARRNITNVLCLTKQDNEALHRFQIRENFARYSPGERPVSVLNSRWNELTSSYPTCQVISLNVLPVPSNMRLAFSTRSF